MLIFWKIIIIITKLNLHIKEFSKNKNTLLNVWYLYYIHKISLIMEKLLHTSVSHSFVKKIQISLNMYCVLLCKSSKKISYFVKN